MTFEKPTNLSDPIDAPYRRVAHWMALGAAVFTLPLLYVGGSVTTYRVGLAVPDWPETFGINMFLFNMWEHPFGVRVEHSHRLYGAAVGLFTLDSGRLAARLRAEEMDEVAGPCRGGNGDRSGCAGRHASHADIDDSGSRSRLCRSGILRAHGSTVRLHRPAVAEPGRYADRIGVAEAAGLGHRRSWCLLRSCWEAGCGILGRGRRW